MRDLPSGGSSVPSLGIDMIVWELVREDRTQAGHRQLGGVWGGGRTDGLGSSTAHLYHPPG